MPGVTARAVKEHKSPRGNPRRRLQDKSYFSRVGDGLVFNGGCRKVFGNWKSEIASLKAAICKASGLTMADDLLD